MSPTKITHGSRSRLIQIGRTGAINRAAVEKEPTITYEDFVNELDTGDAFTTSLIDILVKVGHTLEYASNTYREWA